MNPGRCLPGLAACLCAFASGSAAAQTPLGPELHVNTTTSEAQSEVDLSMASSGEIVVVWSSDHAGLYDEVMGQRSSADGTPPGPTSKTPRSPTARPAGSRRHGSSRLRPMCGCAATPERSPRVLPCGST